MLVKFCKYNYNIIKGAKGRFYKMLLDIGMYICIHTNI